jgi:hypothetical protein
MRQIIQTSILGWFLTIFICSCSTEPSFCGKYEVPPRSISYILFLHGRRARGRVVGSTLSLDTDSTFFYHMCGNELRGRWTKLGDSVVLNVSSNIYLGDSMKLLAPPAIPNNQISFRIWKRQLYRLMKIEEGETIELLTRKK